MLTKDAETLELPPSVRYPPIRHSRESGIHLIVSAREAKTRVKGGRLDSRFRGNDIVSLLALQGARRGAGFLPLATGGAYVPTV